MLLVVHGVRVVQTGLLLQALHFRRVVLAVRSIPVVLAVRGHRLVQVVRAVLLVLVTP
jgi:hypothetical protein